MKLKLNNTITVMGILVLFFVVSILLIPAQYLTAQASWHNGAGNGSGSNPFLIANVSQFRQFVIEVNSGNILQTDHIRLISDIDLNNVPHTPIGTEIHPFRGSFDGNYHRIHRLLINAPNLNRAGLFGVADIGAKIENVAVEGSITAQNEVGGIVGWMNGGTVLNSFFSGSITGENDVGGIAGSIITSDIRNSYSKGYIEGLDAVGGILGRSDGTTNLEHNFSASRIEGTGLAGGIVGNMHSGNLSESVALNSHIISPNASRIASGTAANLSSNFAFDRVINNAGTTQWQNIGINNRDGHSITNTQILSRIWWRGETNWSEWRDEAGFNNGIWYFRDDYLPVLRGFTANGVIQSGRVLHIRPSIRRAVVKWADGADWADGNELVFNRLPQIPSSDDIALSDGADSLVHGTHFEICGAFILENAAVYDRVNVAKDGDGNFMPNVPVRLKIRGLAPHYDGYILLDYYIVPRLLLDEHLYLPAEQREFVFSGQVIIPQFQIRYGGNIGLAAGGSFNVLLDSGVNVGSHLIRLELRGNYRGTIERSFNIVRAAGAGVLSINRNGWYFGQWCENDDIPALEGVAPELYNDGFIGFFVNGEAWDTWIAHPVINAGRYRLEARFNQTANFNALILSVYFYVRQFQREGMPDMPNISEITNTTILLEAQGTEGQIEFAYRRYGDTETVLVWRTSLMFYNLSPNTRYEIFARYAAIDERNFIAGQKSEALVVYTGRNQLHPIVVAAIIFGSAAAVGACVFAVFFVIAKKKKE